MNWEEARQKVAEGETVLFHHREKVVPVGKDTKLSDLQWMHFGAFGLTWQDIVNGKYSVVRD
jgi:hypothetical protein